MCPHCPVGSGRSDQRASHRSSRNTASGQTVSDTGHIASILKVVRVMFRSHANWSAAYRREASDDPTSGRDTIIRDQCSNGKCRDYRSKHFAMPPSLLLSHCTGQESAIAKVKLDSRPVNLWKKLPFSGGWLLAGRNQRAYPNPQTREISKLPGARIIIASESIY